MSDGILFLVFVGVLVSSAAVIALLRAASGDKKKSKPNLFDLNQK